MLVAGNCCFTFFRFDETFRLLARRKGEDDFLLSSIASDLVDDLSNLYVRWSISFSILFAATRFFEVFSTAQLLPRAAFIFHENEISRVKEKSKCKEFVHRSMIFISLRSDTFLERFTKFAIAELLPASLFPMETRFPDRESLRSIAREPKWNAKDKGSLETRRDV